MGVRERFIQKRENHAIDSLKSKTVTQQEWKVFNFPIRICIYNFTTTFMRVDLWIYLCLNRNTEYRFT